MSRTLAGLLVVALLAAAGAPAAAAEPPLPLAKPGRSVKAVVAGPPLPTANPQRGGKSVHSIVVPVQLTQVHAKVKSAQIVCGVWRTKALAEKFEKKHRLGVGEAEVPLDTGPDGQHYIGPGLSVNIFSERGKGTLRRGQAWACGLTFELEDGTVEAPGEAKSAKPSPLTAGGGQGTTFRPKVFGIL